MIYRQIGPLDYEIYLSKGKTKIVHHNRLKKYLGLKHPPGYFQALAAAKKQHSSNPGKGGCIG